MLKFKVNESLSQKVSFNKYFCLKSKTNYFYNLNL